jgi:hypothetical protein
MPLAGYVCVLIPLLAVCCFFPGFLIVRRLRWTPLEKLCASVGLSLLLLYLATWATYCFGPHDERPVFRAIIAAAALCGVFCWRDTLRLFGTFRVRQTALAFAAFLVYTFALLCMIRVYSGLGWVGDWTEHLQRTIFFLDRLPLDVKINTYYTLPARPPMQNVLAALFLGATTDRFELLQATFAFLNALIFLPCVLILPALGGTRRRVLPLLFLLAASPMVMENVVYVWTKSLAAFFVVLAISLYLSGMRKDGPRRTAAAFLAFAAGMLVHYSAGPYLLFVGLHYTLRVLRSHPVRWREFAAAAIPAALVLATWLGWSAHVYGMKATLASNTTVSSPDKPTIDTPTKIVGNLTDSIVPALLRSDMESWKQANPGGLLRDYAFAFYQLNAIFAMGLLGGPLIVWLVCRRLFARSLGSEPAFWRALIPVCVILGIAVVGERDHYGSAHLTLLSLEVLGLCFLASLLPAFRRTARIVVVAFCCVDFALGVYWQARIESLENTGRQTVFTELIYDGASIHRANPTDLSLTETAWQNWLYKHSWELYHRWLRDLPVGHDADRQFQEQWVQLRQILLDEIQSVTVNWGAWPARHGGVIAYLGDSVAGGAGAGTDIASALVVLLFACGCALVIRMPVLSRADFSLRRASARPAPKKSRR